MKRLFTVVIALLMIFAVFSPMTSFASSQYGATIMNGTLDVTGYLEETPDPLSTSIQVAIQNYVLEHTNSVPEDIQTFRYLESLKASQKFNLPFEDVHALLQHYTIYEWSPAEYIELPDLYASSEAIQVGPFAYDDQPFSRTFHEDIKEKYLSNVLATYSITVSAIRNNVSGRCSFQGASASRISGQQFSHYPRIYDKKLQYTFLKTGDYNIPVPVSDFHYIFSSGGDIIKR